jgi:hypothetical protein
MPYFVNITKRLFTQTKFAGVKDFQSNTILPQQKSFAYSTYTMKLYIDFVYRFCEVAKIVFRNLLLQLARVQMSSIVVLYVLVH